MRKNWWTWRREHPPRLTKKREEFLRHILPGLYVDIYKMRLRGFSRPAIMKEYNKGMYIVEKAERLCILKMVREEYERIKAIERIKAAEREEDERNEQYPKDYMEITGIQYKPRERPALRLRGDCLPINKKLFEACRSDETKIYILEYSLPGSSERQVTWIAGTSVWHAWYLFKMSASVQVLNAMKDISIRYWKVTERWWTTKQA